jgi:xanthine dehydrogenase accessory factor
MLFRVLFATDAWCSATRGGDMDLATVQAAIALLERGESFAWVTILGTLGSSPRHAGAAMVVPAQGPTHGTIGGGPLEATATDHARASLGTVKWRLVHFDSAELGMLCGGKEAVLIDCVEPDRPGVQELFAGLRDLLRVGRKGWLVTVLPADRRGDARVRRCLVDSGGGLRGDPAFDPEDLRVLAKKGGSFDYLKSADPERTYVEPVAARGSAYVFGAGHCGQKLVPVLSMLGFATVVVDDRPEFANADRFPTADRIVVAGSYAGVMETLPIDEQSYVVIMTRSHAFDRDVLAEALRTPAIYVGMIGSTTKIAQTFKALEERGFSSSDLARVHSPIGLPIGGETPEEIAVGIAAELVQVRTAQSQRP